MTGVQTPFAALAAVQTAAPAWRGELMSASRAVEARAFFAAPPLTVWLCIQRAENLDAETSNVCKLIAQGGADLHIYGHGLDRLPEDWPANAIAHPLEADDPLVREWAVLYLAHGEGAALAGREEPGSSGRLFRCVRTRHGGLVARAADALVSRVSVPLVPRLPAPVPSGR